MGPPGWLAAPAMLGTGAGPLGAMVGIGGAACCGPVTGIGMLPGVVPLAGAGIGGASEARAG